MILYFFYFFDYEEEVYRKECFDKKNFPGDRQR